MLGVTLGFTKDGVFEVFRRLNQIHQKFRSKTFLTGLSASFRRIGLK